MNTTRTVEAKTVPAFTLIELMVAVSIFAIVMMVGVGALLSMVSVNKRTQAINAVMNNLNAAVEEMARSIRVGTTYHCETSAAYLPPSEYSYPQDCAQGGGKLLGFEPTGGDPLEESDQEVYRLNGTHIERSKDAGQSWVALTAPEVEITDFQFYVNGTDAYPADSVQPRVMISIRGSAQIEGGSTDFLVQTTVTQRLLDI